MKMWLALLLYAFAIASNAILGSALWLATKHDHILIFYAKFLFFACQILLSSALPVIWRASRGWASFGALALALYACHLAAIVAPVMSNSGQSMVGILGLLGALFVSSVGLPMIAVGITVTRSANVPPSMMPATPPDFSSDILKLVKAIVADGIAPFPGLTFHDGEIISSQRDLADALGISASRLRRQLTAYQAGGTLHVETSGGITRLRLVKDVSVPT